MRRRGHPLFVHVARPFPDLGKHCLQKAICTFSNAWDHIICRFTLKNLTRQASMRRLTWATIVRTCGKNLSCLEQNHFYIYIKKIHTASGKASVTR